MNSQMMIAPLRLVHRFASISNVALMAVVLSAGLSACSVTPRQDPPSYGNWQEAVGEPVQRVRFSHLIDWQPLDREWVLLEFSDGRMFALEVRDPCITDTREASSLELDTAMKNTLHRSDRVRLDEYRCLIETIRPFYSPSELNGPDKTGFAAVHPFRAAADAGRGRGAVPEIGHFSGGT